ncbi:cytochrome P450 4C1 isoform X2 [Acyrthosiphon pisum]|uniref:Cytochrome P450 n=1 Tax=Acyrthosiphon pisum TaxID=7029 RepID=A0A8R2JR95_ACYPI|nr:cytochrome P450 4C1 isoform X2 [Acyrthosiphon pisum]
MFHEHAPERNKESILSSLKNCMDPSGGSLLEISSGSGQHISYFAAHFPNIEFQPTEINRRLFETINACTHNLSNVLPAKYLDVSSDPSVWLGGQLMNTQYDYILNINTLHVSNFKCTEGLFRGSCCALKPKETGAIIMQSVGEFRLAVSEVLLYSAIISVVVFWCSCKWNNRHINKLDSKMKGPPAYPIIGSALELLGTPEQVINVLLGFYNNYGSEPFKVWLGPFFGVYIIKPEDVQIVLNNSKALQKDRFYEFIKNIFGEGLLTAPVDKWRKHRRLITPLFNANLLSQFFPVFNEKNKILIRNLKKELGKTQPFDLWDYIAPTTLNLICQNAMGYNLDSHSQCGSEFEKAMIKASELDSIRIYKPWLFPNIFFSLFLRLQGQSNVFKTLKKLPLKMINEKKEVFAQKKIVKETIVMNNTDGEKKNLKVFLDTLFELNETGANFSDNDILDEVVTMMIGGSETSAITLCFSLLLLAIHPDIQNKVYDEIYDVLGDGDQTITTEDTIKLVYLEQVLKETLRLFPVLPLVIRKLQDDVKISTTCYIAPLFTHRDCDSYPNPLNFNPENFSQENISKRHKYSFIAFSGGPRGCIGSKYAMLSMKVMMSMFLRNYSVHTNCKFNDIKLKLDLLLRSANGYPVFIQSRDRRPSYKLNKT